MKAPFYRNEVFLNVLFYSLWVGAASVVGLLVYGLTYKLWAGILCGVIAVVLLPVYIVVFVDWWERENAKWRTPTAQALLFCLASFLIGFIVRWKMLPEGENFLGRYAQAALFTFVPLFIGLMLLFSLFMLYRLLRWLTKLSSRFFSFLDKIFNNPPP